MKIVSPTIPKLHIGMGEDVVVLVLTLMLALGITGINMTFSGHKDRLLLQHGEVGMYEIEGSPWSVIYFSVSADKPVTVCITDENGQQMLKAGSGMCLFLAEHVTHISRIWRFPVKGPLYLVIIPEGEKSPVSVEVEIRSLMNTW